LAIEKFAVLNHVPVEAYAMCAATENQVTELLVDEVKKKM
jgi:hypothetical protein